MNNALIAQSLIQLIPYLAQFYEELRKDLKDEALPPVEELLTKADVANDSVIGIADGEIAKYKK